jgi:hypothetical protein
MLICAPPCAGRRRDALLVAEGLDEVLACARRRGGDLEHAFSHELRQTCLTQLGPSFS